MLGSSDRPLSSAYDLAMLDLDGVVYVDGDAVPGAPEHLERVRSAGMRLAFVTNNAARSPQTVARRLSAMGVPAEEHDVVTSAQAAARILLDRLGAGASVAVLGAEGLTAAIGEAGLRAVGVDDDAEALVSGYGPDVLWRDVMRAAVRVRDGLWWVASNTDLTIPTAYGLAPGHGVLVETVRRFSGVDPVVAGKPQRPLLDETVRRVGGSRPLMVGDRLDTDIEGASNAGIDSMLVMTGVTNLEALVAAAPPERPTYLAADLGGLLEPHEAPVETVHGFDLGGWTGGVEGTDLTVSGSGPVDAWWRVVAATAWGHADRTGRPPSAAALTVPRG